MSHIFYEDLSSEMVSRMSRLKDNGCLNGVLASEEKGHASMIYDHSDWAGGYCESLDLGMTNEGNRLCWSLASE
eukprot:c44017_g1_i1 orf=26-247(+)